jgi:hypothetical protein
MPGHFEERYIYNRCLKELKKQYDKDKRYPNIPLEEKKRILILIRWQLSHEIVGSSSKLDGTVHYARSLVNLEKIDSVTMLEGSENIILRWLWSCIKKDIDKISRILLQEQIFIPQGDEQKALQEEYLGMISDVTKVLIKRVVENLDASYISDTELNEIVKRYSDDPRFPTISSDEKQLILKRLRHRVATVLHKYSDEVAGEKKIAKWLLDLETMDKIQCGTKGYVHICWLLSCVKKELSKIEEVFKYDAISIPHDENQVSLRNEYLELIADAAKALIKETALSFDELNQYDVTVTSDNVPQHKSILKRPESLTHDDNSSRQGETKHIVWQLDPIQSTDAQPTKKQRFADNASVEENLSHATTGYTY